MPSRKRTRTLDPIFSPRSIAVIGASQTEGSVGRAVFNNILLGGFTGIVYPVNLKAHSVCGVRAYPSISDISEKVDLAVVIVPAAAVPEVVEECGKNGVKGLVIISAGFKEVGKEGAELENETAAIAKKHSMRLIGPNCLGVINTDTNVQLNTSFATKMPAQGSIAFASQSGALCAAILDFARGEKIGFSKFVSMGNKADINENDLLEYLGADPHTKVILLYVEDIIDGRKC
jgi:acetyltransferase